MDKRVLVAEDDKASQVLLKMIFKRLGHNIDIVPDGRVVLENLKEHTYDLIILDVKMPKLNGIDTAIKIRENGIYTPIIMLTGYDDPDIRDKLMRAGVNEYMVKSTDTTPYEELFSKYLSEKK